jgi:hypothetical protein
MYYDIIDTKKKIKPNDFKNWCINQFESIVGEFPEIEKQKESRDENLEIKEKPLLKKYKTLRYIVFPIVLVLIIIDEIYIRIKDSIKKIDESE